MSSRTSEMERSWLVQRMRRPTASKGAGILAALGDNPFAFGGGLRDGGLGADAMDLLRPVVAFDHMGAAEFEFGALPEALSRMVREDPDDPLAASTVSIDLADVRRHWTDRTRSVPTGSAEVHLLCRGSQAVEVERRVRGWAAGSAGFDTKEAVMLSDALRPPAEYPTDVCGWVEISNGFVFCTDGEMFAGLCGVFGVETDVGPGVAS